MADKRGRPKGRKSLRTNKKQATMSMTPEAWAILTKKAKDLGIYKSDYVENLVRRGDLATYDMTITFLLDLLGDLKVQLDDLDIVRGDLVSRMEEIREFLRSIGVSPSVLLKNEVIESEE